MLQPDAFCDNTSSKMRLRPGLRLGLRWGSLIIALPRPPGFKGTASRRGGGEGEKGKGGEGKGNGGEGLGGREKGGKG